MGEVGKQYIQRSNIVNTLTELQLDPNANEQTRTMAAFMYYILYEQITGLQKSQTGCATEFRCEMTPFKRLITGKRQPGRPGRSGGTGKSGRKLEEVAKLEGATPAKQLKVTPKTTCGRGQGGGRAKRSK